MKKDILIGIVGVVLGLAIGFVAGQEYFKYQIRTELSKGIEHFAGLFGVNREVQKTDKVNENAKNEPIKQAASKEVPFDDSRMSNEGYLNTKWGMNTQEVLDITGGNLIEGKGVYVDSEIAGDNSTVFFSFVSDK